MRWFENGTRKSRQFKTEADAKAFSRSLVQEELFAEYTVTPEERVWLKRINETGVSLNDLLTHASRIAAGRKDCPAHAAKDQFLADCRRRNLRPATLAHYEGMLSRFLDGRGGSVRSLTRSDVRGWIEYAYNQPASRYTARTPVMAWLRWCARQGYCDPAVWRDPLKFETPLGDQVIPGILRPGELYLLLKRLPEKHRFPLALCCLTGIRPDGEVGRLRWENFDFRRKVITVTGKTRRERQLHDLPDVVWKWAKAYRSEGKVLQTTYRHWRAAIRKHFWRRWPNDASRHSFASYGYHHLGPERTVELMGHEAGYGMFAKRYKANARAWSAKLWFTISP